MTDNLEFAREVLKKEMAGISLLADRLDTSFLVAVDTMLNCRGKVCVMGIGKSGHVGSKVAATLASTGQPAWFVHPAEAAHGDSGMIASGDVCLVISHSGESEELFKVLPGLRMKGVPVISITGKEHSRLSTCSDVLLLTHVNGEACPYGLAPTTSTTVSMALGDALALVLMKIRGIKERDFAERHPGGALGRRFMDITDRIDAVTRIGEDRIACGGIQPAPKSVKIELTQRCDLRCKFCALRTRPVKSFEDMNFELFKRITEDMRLSGVEEIGLFYLGESFMAPELLIRACFWVKQELEFPWVFLTSNGTNAKAEYVRELYRAGLDSLKWSVNTFNKKQFGEICQGTEAQFDRIMANIKDAWAIRDGYDTMISASSILYESDQKERMDEFLTKNVRPFVDRHYWLPMYSMSMYRAKIQADTGFTASIGNMGRIDDRTGLPNRPPLPCWAAFTEGHVRVDGGLSACCFGATDKFDMGKLDGFNFMQEWNSEKFQTLRKAQLATVDDGPEALENTCCKVCVAWSGGE